MDWPLLSTLPPAERERLLASTRPHRFGRGEVLVREGDAAESLHLVEDGRLAVRLTTASGDNATLNVLGPGDWFGELSLLDERPPTRSATVVALEPGLTRVLPGTAFAELRRRNPGADRLLLALMARRIEELSARLVEAMYDALDRRVHRRLADLVRVYGSEAQGPVSLPVTQELLAELAGGTRPSVNQVLQRMVHEGCVELRRGRITVLDPHRLAVRAR